MNCNDVCELQPDGSVKYNIPPGKDQYALVKGKWDKYLAAYRYKLLVWDTSRNSWMFHADGLKDWADKTAKHYKIKIQ